MLKHRHVAELRDLVEQAAAGKVKFNRQFATDILYEVIRGEQRLARYRKIVSYATLPISFVPWVGTAAQVVADEALERLVESRIKREHRWFYMLSDLSNRRA